MSSPFRIGQPVLAYSGSIIYSAIVVRIQRRANAFCYFVHYDKWADEYNEWVEGNRVMAMTPANVERMVCDNEPHFQRNPGARPAARPPDAATVAAAAAFVAAFSATGAAATPSASSSAAAASAATAPPAAGAKRRVDTSRETVCFEEGESALLPVALKAALRDDWEAIVGKRLLHRVPCEPKLSAKGVVDAYLDFCAGGPPPVDPTKAQKGGRRRAGGAAAVAAVAAGGVGVVDAGEAAADGAPSPAAAGESGSGGGGDDGGGGGGGSASSSAAAAAAAAPPKKKSHAKGAQELLLIRQSLAALLDFFNRALPVSLLYRHERLWGNAWGAWQQEKEEEGRRSGLGQNQAPEACTQFPAVFLLRLFVALPQQLRGTEMSLEQVELMEAHAGDFLKWLEKYRAAFLPMGPAGEGYVHASAEHAAARDALLARKRSSEKQLGWTTVYAAEST